MWDGGGILEKERGEGMVVDRKGMGGLFEDVFGNRVLEVGERNDKMVGVSGGMG